MRNPEKIIMGLIIGSLFPLILGLLSVTVWLLFDKSESRPFIYLASGLFIGGLIDIKFLKQWIDRRFNLPVLIVALIYLIYNVFVFGFFMGFPVFNAFMGLLAGFYFGNRVCFNKIDAKKHPKLINQVSIFTGLIMTLICISSGFLAIYDNGASGMIQNILGLNFEISRSILWMIVLIGGLLLILINILLTRIIMIKTIKNTVSKK